jgi:hypothetical protein
MVGIGNEAADRLAIQALAYRYAAGVDRRDREVFLSAFATDATLQVFGEGPDGDDPVSIMTGHEEIGAVPSIITRYAKTFHFVGNHLCEVDGDRATGEVYCTARHLSPSIHGATDFVMFIRYVDRYRRDSERTWLIADRQVHIDWTERHAALETLRG